MKNLYLIAFLVLYATCVDPIEFEAETEVGVLVVDGHLATGPSGSTVKLLRTDILGKRVFPPVADAQVTIFDDQGKSEVYQEVEPGTYRLPSSRVWGLVGHTYYIEIDLANGKSYRSRPEKILPAPPIDELTFEVTSQIITVNEVREFEQVQFNLYANGRLTAAPEETFIQWQLEHVWAVTEIVCSPLHQPKTCYIKPPVSPNELFLLDGSQLAPGARFSEQLASVEVDAAFGQVASFYVTQRAITQEAYTYWSNVRQIVNNVGSIFDAPPAAIPGNIFSVDDSEEQVLGFFSAFDQKQRLALIRSPDLGDKGPQPFCGLPGLPPSPLPQACCSCTILEHSSVQRPSYWP